jgi:hypothetical protein
VRCRLLACLVKVWPCAALILALVSCDRRTEPFIPLEQEPPAPERPVRIPGLETPDPRDPALLEARRDPALQAERVAGEALLSGTLRLAAGSSPPEGGVVFVIARGASGPPLAVKRLAMGEFPLAFSLGPRDVMIPGRRLEGRITLGARVDGDGDPLTRDPDDLEGWLGTPVEPPAANLEILLAGAR